MWKLAIRRPVTFLMVFLVVLGFGFFALQRLNPELLPDISIPIAGVITTYRGAGPQEIENLVTKPIEGAVASVTGVTDVRSIIREGLSVTILEFDWNQNMDQAAIDIREKIDLIEGFLPEDVSKPMVIKFDPTMMPVAMVSLSGDRPLVELRRVAEDNVKPRLERIKGVASASVIGGLEREVQIRLHAQRLELYGIGVSDVINALRAQNLSFPGGSVERGGLEYTVRTLGEFTSTKEIEDVIVGINGRTPVKVRDIGDVVDTHEEKTSEVRINGKTGLMLMIQKESGAVTVDVSKRIQAALAEMTTNKDIPEDLTLDIMMDQADFINRSLGHITSNLLVGALLAALILLLFLHNIPSTIIVGLAIPMSVIGTFVAMDAFGLTLNMMSMAGLALAVGMLVDNAIVVLENTFRHRQTGLGKKEAATLGTSEVATAVTASTLTTISVFVPVIFIPGIIGIMTKDLSLTVVFSLAISLLFALTLIPMLSSRFLNVRPVEQPARNSFEKLSDWIGHKLKGLEDVYRRTLGWCLKRKKLVIGLAAAALVVSVMLVFPFRLIGTEFIPTGDMGRISVNIELPPGTPFEQTEAIASQVEQIVFEQVAEDELEAVAVQVGGGAGGMAMFGGMSGARSYRASVDVELVESTERSRSQEQIEETLRPILARIPGAKITQANSQQMSSLGIGTPVSVEIYGNDFSLLERIAEAVKDSIQQVPGTRDVETSLEKKSPELRLKISKEKAQSVGLPVALIANAVNASVQGKVASFYREAGKEYNIRVRLREQDRINTERLLALPIKTPLGKVVTLASVAEALPAEGPMKIDRKGQERMVTVDCDIGGRDLGSITREVKHKVSQIPIPENYRIHVSGQAEEQQETFSWLFIAMLAAVVLVYMVMAALYESFLDPFVIMLTFPLSLIGVIWMLFLTNTTLSVLSLVGAVMLVGIIVNNGIVMVDYINLLRKRDKMPLREAVVTGGTRRLRPVLMTALTTIFAMIPMAIGAGAGGQLRAPMARSVIGGLIVGTFMTLFVIPVLYTVFEMVGERRRLRKEAQKRKV